MEGIEEVRINIKIQKASKTTLLPIIWEIIYDQTRKEFKGFKKNSEPK